MVSKYDNTVNNAKEKLKQHKILFVEGNVDGTVGGSYYVLYDLIKNINKKKYKPIVVFYRNNSIVQRLKENQIETLILERTNPFVFKIKEKNNFLAKNAYQILRPVQRTINIFKRLIMPSLQIACLLKTMKIELVNLNNSITRNYEWMLAAKLSGIKCITHEMGINEKFSLTSRFFGARLEAIISVSNAITQNMKRLGCDYPNIHTIQNSIDLSRYNIKKRPKELRRIYAFDEKDPIIGSVGNVKRWKGQETVVRATQIIKKSFPNIRCMLVGGCSDSDLEYLAALKELCNNSKLQENVIFTGFKNNPIDYMNLMDIVIHSSIEPEPFGIVNLEAMYVKKPIISTKIGGPVEIFEDGKSGILVEPGDSEALAEACKYLLSNKDKATEMGNAAFERLNTHFTLEKNIEKTQELYDAILAS